MTKLSKLDQPSDSYVQWLNRFGFGPKGPPQTFFALGRFQKVQIHSTGTSCERATSSEPGMGVEFDASPPPPRTPIHKGLNQIRSIAADLGLNLEALAYLLKLLPLTVLSSFLPSFLQGRVFAFFFKASH